MSCNVGSIDRALRIIVGLVLIGWAAFAGGPVWAWIGVLPLATGLFKFCPAYTLLGMNTWARRSKHRPGGRDRSPGEYAQARKSL
jgi:hypothetical protein